MKKPKGLKLNGGVWHIDKVINGVRICRTTRTGDLAEAMKILAQVETAKRAYFASVAWETEVESMPTDAKSWIGRTIQRINKPSVKAAKGHPSISANTLKLILLRSNGKCEITGIKFSDEIPTGSKTAPFSMSLDRIDSSKGYVLENCRVVCLAVNLGMREWGENVMVRIGKAMMLRELEREVRGEVA
jgi:hypothetical protein